MRDGRKEGIKVRIGEIKGKKAKKFSSVTACNVMNGITYYCWVVRLVRIFISQLMN